MANLSDKIAPSGVLTPGDNISTLTNDSGYLTGITGQSIKNLSDVYSSMSPTDGQVLTYDATNGWQAETAASPVKAWVNFNGTGTVAIRDSLNVSSITDNGTGEYTVNFSSALADANYAVATGTTGNGGDNLNITGSGNFGTATLKTASQLGLKSTTGGGGAIDAAEANVIVAR